MSGRVLIVDDDPVVLEMIEGALKLGGFEVVRADDAQDALFKMRQGATDLLLTDLEMPMVNGVQLIATIREDPSLRITPIIAVTAHAEEFIGQDARRAGCVSFITKPFSPQQLIQQVRRGLGLSHEVPVLPSRPRLDVDESNVAAPLRKPAAVVELDRRATGAVDNSTIFDRDSFLEYMDGSLDYAQRAIGILLSTLPANLRKIRQSIISVDSEMLRMSAHSLKGSLAFFAAPTVVELAFQLEKIGQSGDLTAAPAVYFDLERALARLVPALDEFVRGGGGQTVV